MLHEAEAALRASHAATKRRGPALPPATLALRPPFFGRVALSGITHNVVDAFSTYIFCLRELDTAADCRLYESSETRNHLRSASKCRSACPAYVQGTLGCHARCDVQPASLAAEGRTRPDAPAFRTARARAGSGRRGGHWSSSFASATRMWAMWSVDSVVGFPCSCRPISNFGVAVLLASMPHASF